MRQWRYLLSLLLVVTGLGIVSGPVQAAPNALVQPGSTPATDGTTVVWDNQGIYAARYPDWNPVLVSSIPGMGYLYPDVSGDWVVWQQNCVAATCQASGTTIQARNLATGQQVDVANGYAPRVSGTRVLYETNLNIRVRDLSSPADPMIVAPIPAGWGIHDARISGDRLAWIEYQSAPHGATSWRVKAGVIGQQPVTVADGVGPFFGLDLCGNTLVYVGGPSLMTAVNLATGMVTSLPGKPYDEQPTTDGRYVFWQRINFGPGTNPDGRRVDIIGYDLQSGSSFTVVENDGTNQSPVAGGDLVTWEHWTSPTVNVHATTIRNVLPTAPRPDPGSTRPDWFYFQETQHYLSFGFKDFWSRSGGVPIFGFPLTEEFSEMNPDQGKMLTVQYLERQRFEYHPEFAGTPYQVELGRLGAEDAAKRHLTGTPPFQSAVIPSTAIGDTCEYFGETHHNICGDFLAYWQTHGLDFGDPGISYRESLALFGYPISEPYVDPQTGLLTQYFERAVFEYHPDNPSPYKVLLRRLGAEDLAARGW